MSTLKRRFWPTSIEFRAIHYLAPNSVELLALEANGQTVWLFNTLTGEMKHFWSDSTLEITAICLAKDYLLMGTFDGRILKYSDSQAQLINQIDCPILLIVDQGTFADSSGRLYHKSKLILDDGVLQPCGLFLSKSTNSLILVKHRTIYLFNTVNESMNTLNLDSEGVFSAATLLNDKILLVATDSGLLYTVDPTEFRLQPLESELSDDSDESESEENSDTETDLKLVANSVKSERIYSIFAQNNTPIVLKVDSIHKRAWLEHIKFPLNHVARKQASPLNFEMIPVICPLCTDSFAQSLPLNASKCSKGHPLTICAIKKELINSVHVFRCRDCKVAYSTNPHSSCKFCSGLLTN